MIIKILAQGYKQGNPTHHMRSKYLLDLENQHQTIVFRMSMSAKNTDLFSWKCIFEFELTWSDNELYFKFFNLTQWIFNETILIRTYSVFYNKSHNLAVSLTAV